MDATKVRDSCLHRSAVLFVGAGNLSTTKFNVYSKPLSFCSEGDSEVMLLAGGLDAVLAIVEQWYWIPLVVAVLIFVLLRRPTLDRGKQGERRVNAALSRLLDKEAYRVVKNVTFPLGTGTTQIDHLVVSRYGIFVIETKNIQGWIFGHPDDARWTQVIY